MAEQADAGDLKSSGLNTLVGSIPTGPIHLLHTMQAFCYLAPYER